MAGDRLLDLDEAVAFVMRNTGKGRRQARAMLLQAMRAGKLPAYVAPLRAGLRPPGEDEAVRIPPEAFPVEH